MINYLRAIPLFTTLVSGGAWAGYFPMYASWPQPDGIGSEITITYSYSNLFDGAVVDAAGQPFSPDMMRSAFERAFADYVAFLPIHFVEITDAGPLPETGQYHPAGLADIRIGAVSHIDDANAYAYFPHNLDTNGLAGDIVFNGQRFGMGWSPIFFYATAQHELGHSLGMGHYLNEDAPSNTITANASYNGPILPLNSETVFALQSVYGAGLGSVTPLTAVPEPASWALLLAGLSITLLARERKHV